MRARILPLIVVLLACFLLDINRSAFAQNNAAGAAAEKKAADQAPKPPNGEADEALPPPVKKDEGLPLEQRFHGVALRSDGVLEGHVYIIDPSSLELTPVTDAEVFFIQNGRVITRSVTGNEGRFTMSDLTPRAVYSVVVRGGSSSRASTLAGYPDHPRNKDFFGAFSVAVFAPQDLKVTQKEDSLANRRDLVFAENVAKLNVAKLNVVGIGAFLNLTVISYRDLAAVGLPAGLYNVPGNMGGATTGGGGGGGGGGASGAGVLGLLGGAALGAAAAGGGDNLASPFKP